MEFFGSRHRPGFADDEQQRGVGAGPRGGGSWPGGSDPSGRRGSERREDFEGQSAKPGFQLLWKAKMDNQPRQLCSLAQPLLLQNIIS